MTSATQRAARMTISSVKQRVDAAQPGMRRFSLIRSGCTVMVSTNERIVGPRRKAVLLMPAIAITAAAAPPRMTRARGSALDVALGVLDGVIVTWLPPAARYIPDVG